MGLTNSNIVFIGNFSYPKGMAETKRIKMFIDYLINKNFDVKLLILRQGEEFRVDGNIYTEENGVTYRTIGGRIKLNIYMIFWLPHYFFSGIKQLYRWKKRNSNNILYVTHGATIENIIFILFGKFAGYFVVFDIVEDNTFIQERLHPFGKIKWFIGEKLEKHIAFLADGIIVISTYLENIYREIVGCRVPISLIPISAEAYNVTTRKNSDGVVRLVYSGSFAKKDGVEILVDAFKRVYESSVDCILLLTGKGANLPIIKERITNHKAIKYVGYLEDDEFYKFLYDADILCATRIGSIYANAGFPFKLGEYLATGNPVIVSDVGDVGIYLENMQDAIIVEPGSVSALAEAIIYCIEHKEYARAIGANGKRQCKKHFSPQVNGEKLLSLLREVVT